MKGLRNIKTERYTTGTGIALFIVVAAKLAGVDPEELTGMTTSDVILITGAGISALLLLFSKDPHK